MSFVVKCGSCSFCRQSVTCHVSGICIAKQTLDQQWISVPQRGQHSTLDPTLCGPCKFRFINWFADMYARVAPESALYSNDRVTGTLVKAQITRNSYFTIISRKLFTKFDCPLMSTDFSPPHR